MKPELTIIPTCIVHPSSVIIYNQVIWSPSKPTQTTPMIGVDDPRIEGNSFINSERKSNGNVSIQAKRKISKAIEYLITTSTEKKVYERVSRKTVKFKIAFVTLTLPSKQVNPDKVIINKCLNSFLLEIKQFYNVQKYVWRAEKQKNGNIHFHLIIDQFIPFYEMRNRWNRIVNKLDYVNNYQKNMQNFYNNGFRKSANKNDKRPEALQYLSYKKASSTNFNNPNSTDIHSTKKIRNIKSYLTKYLTKNEKKEPETQQQNIDLDVKNCTKDSEKFSQTGRIWGCSHNLSKITGFRSEIDNELVAELTKLKESGKCKIHSETYFTVMYINFDKLKQIGCEILFNYFSEFLIEKFDYHVQLSL